jgi:predicted regulator of Ras-like GTPase activity (Roadblock/LC7/MglB family)
MLETLEKIVAGIPHAVGAVLMGFDGIAVEHYSVPGSESTFDVESIAMEFSLRFIELRAAAESLELGAITDITLKAEHALVLVRVLSPDYFVAVVMDDPAHFGKGRWVLRTQASALSAELG